MARSYATSFGLSFSVNLSAFQIDVLTASEITAFMHFLTDRIKAWYRKSAAQAAVRHGSSPSSKIWGGIQRSIKTSLSGNTIVVTSDHKAAGMKEYGGTVRAGQGRFSKGAKYLAIPIARKSRAGSGAMSLLPLYYRPPARGRSRSSSTGKSKGFGGTMHASRKGPPLFALYKSTRIDKQSWLPLITRTRGEVKRLTRLFFKMRGRAA